MKLFRIVIVSLFGALALNSVTVSIASAEFNYEFHATDSHTMLEGFDVGANDEFVSDTGTVTCADAKYLGTTSSATSQTVTLEPIFNECNLWLGHFFPVGVEFKGNGCALVFDSVTRVGTSNYEGNTDIVCTGGASMEFASTFCTFSIGSQENLTNVTYTNENNENDIRIDVTINGQIDYEETGESCDSPGQFTTNGSYDGDSTLEGFTTPGSARNVWVT